MTFRNHLDGAAVRLTPARVVEMQARLGVDVAMALDECPPWPVEREAAAASLERTQRWARLSREHRGAAGPALFGIVQGSVYRDLRERAVAELAELEFDGYAIGGVSVGEPRDLRRRVVEWTAPLLPPGRPRYLMGVGTPAELAHAVAQGVDLFDCVLPSRNARHGLIYTRAGELQIRNARHRNDPRPLDPECSCPTCAQVSRAFLHHLFRAREITGRVLATLHNIRYYLDFMGELREAIESGELADLAASLGARQAREDPSPSRSGSAVPQSQS